MGWRMPSSRTDAVSSASASASCVWRGCRGSGRMRWMAMANAPSRRCRPAWAPAAEGASAGEGSRGFRANADAAVLAALAREPLAARFKLVEEEAGDGTGMGTGGMERDGNAIGDGFLVGGE